MHLLLLRWSINRALNIVCVVIVDQLITWTLGYNHSQARLLALLHHPFLRHHFLPFNMDVELRLARQLIHNHLPHHVVLVFVGYVRLLDRALGIGLAIGREHPTHGATL